MAGVWTGVLGPQQWDLEMSLNLTEPRNHFEGGIVRGPGASAVKNPPAKQEMHV